MQDRRPLKDIEIHTLNYAGFGSVKEPRPPKILFRKARRCLIVVAALLATGLIADRLLLASLLGVLVAGFAVVWMGRAARNNRIQIIPAPMLVDSLTVRKFRVLSVVALLACMALASFMLPRWMEAAASVSASSNSMSKLRGIESALWMYIDEYGVPADSLQRLLGADLASARVLIEPMDTTTVVPGPPYYSSYAYFPTADDFFVCEVSAQVICAFSKEARFPTSGGLRREWRRAVAFGSRFELMTDHEFQTAIKEDQKARRTLGWPVYLWDQNTHTVSRATDP